MHPISVVQAAARAAESAATSVVEDAKAAVEEVEGTQVGLHETHAITEAVEEVEGTLVRLYDTHALKEAVGVGEKAAVEEVEGTQVGLHETHALKELYDMLYLKACVSYSPKYAPAVEHFEGTEVGLERVFHPQEWVCRWRTRLLPLQ